jgi:hypothetical protein
MAVSSIPPSLRQLVVERAQGKCEYCLMRQDVSIYSHEIDHVIAQNMADRQWTRISLWLACPAIAPRVLISRPSTQLVTILSLYFTRAIKSGPTILS